MIPIHESVSSSSPESTGGIKFSPGIYTGFLIYHISFFIIVSTIGLNIVFGIIVDTFSELREERVSDIEYNNGLCLFFQNLIETEQKSNCFICDLPSFDFERRADVSIKTITYNFFVYRASKTMLTMTTTCGSMFIILFTWTVLTLEIIMPFKNMFTNW